MYALVHQDWWLHGGLRLLLPVRSAQDIRQTHTPDEGEFIQPTPVLYRQSVTDFLLSNEYISSI